MMSRPEHLCSRMKHDIEIGTSGRLFLCAQHCHILPAAPNHEADGGQWPRGSQVPGKADHDGADSENGDPGGDKWNVSRLNALKKQS